MLEKIANEIIRKLLEDACCPGNIPEEKYKYSTPELAKKYNLNIKTVHGKLKIYLPEVAQLRKQYARQTNTETVKQQAKQKHINCLKRDGLIQDDIIKDITVKHLVLPEIVKRRNISYKKLWNIVKRLNLRQQVLQNKYNSISAYWKKQTQAIYKAYDQTWGQKISEDILYNDYTLAALRRKYGRSQKFFQSFLSWKDINLVKQVADNARRGIIQRALYASAMASKVTKGHILKPLTSEVIEKFIELKKEEMCRADLKRIIYSMGFGEKKFQELCKQFGEPKRCFGGGKRNGMYGKSPGLAAGIGASGWLVENGIKYHFRSSLELKVFLALIKAGEPVMFSNHRIPYLDEKGEPRTYCPDLVIDTMVIEIKPTTLIHTERNELKFTAARLYCEQFGLKFEIRTEQDFKLTPLTPQIIQEMIKNQQLIVSDKSYDKLMRYAEIT